MIITVGHRNCTLTVVIKWANGVPVFSVFAVMSWIVYSLLLLASLVSIEINAILTSNNFLVFVPAVVVVVISFTVIYSIVLVSIIFVNSTCMLTLQICNWIQISLIQIVVVVITTFCASTNNIISIVLGVTNILFLTYTFHWWSECYRVCKVWTYIIMSLRT